MRMSIERSNGSHSRLRVCVRSWSRDSTWFGRSANTRNREWEPFDRSIDIRIARLRKKIEANPEKPKVLKTVRGASVTGRQPLKYAGYKTLGVAGNEDVACPARRLPR
jgi:hypothetical protein